MKKTLFLILGLLFLHSGINAQVTISEVFYDTPLYEKMKPRIGVDMDGVHHNGEFVELYNNSASPVDLSGYKLGVLRHGYNDYKFPDGSICQPKGCMVIAFRHPNSPSFKLSDIFGKYIPIRDEAKVIYHSSFILGNKGNIVILRNKKGVIVSELEYGTKQASSNGVKFNSVHNNNLLGNPYFADPSFIYTAHATPFKIEQQNGDRLQIKDMLPEIVPQLVETSRSVGEIESKASVSPSGAAIVEVPLSFPPGINNMEPKLSVAYNSQSGIGDLGIGTGLSGISTITRTSESNFFDKKNNTIKFQKEGPFTMDGQRLIRKYGTTYVTFINSLTSIEAIGTSGNGPLYFKVTSPHGIVAEYGSEESGRVYANDNANILSWRVSKVTDLNGNTVSYKYLNDKEKGNYIKEITYGEEEQNRIEFEYVENTYSPVTSFVDGSFFNSKLFLSRIYVQGGGNGFSKYDFKYTDIRLSKIIQNGTNGEKLTLDCNWEPVTENTVKKTIIDTEKRDDSQFINGDINGDGQMDLVRFYRKDNRKNNYITASILNQEKVHNSITLKLPDNSFNENSETYQLLNCIDINDDGKDEILILQKNGNDKTANRKIKVFGYTNGNISEIRTINIPTYYDIGADEQVVWLNWDNDNIPDVAFIGKTGKFILMHNNYNNSITSTFPECESSSTNITNAIAFDYDGDGKDEILLKRNNGWYLSFFVNPAFPNLYLVDRYYSNPQIIDINNDGLNDIVFSSDQLGLRCLTNKGKGVFEEKYINAIYKDLESNPIWKSYTSNTNYPARIYVTDLNIICADLTNSKRNNLFVLAYVKINMDQYNIKVKLTEEKDNYYIVDNLEIIEGEHNKMELLLGDINNDAVPDIIEIEEGKRVIFNTIDVGKRYLLKSIQNNGITRSQFTYGSASNKSLHICPNNEQASDLKYLNSSFPLVELLGQPDGLGETLFTQYKYYNGKVHTNGLGFVGFGKIEQLTNAKGEYRKQITETTWDPSFYLPKSQKTQIYVNGTKAVTDSIIYDVSSLSYIYDRIANVKKKSEIHINELEHSQSTKEYTYDYNDRLSSEKETFDDGSYIKTEYNNYTSRNKVGSIIKTQKHFQDLATFPIRTDFTYDTRSNLIKKVESSNTKQPVTTQFTYNSIGLITSKKTSASLVETIEESYIYDYIRSNRRIRKTEPFADTEFHYNRLTGNLEKEVITLKGATETQITLYTYDGFGRQTQVKYPNGKIKTTVLKWRNDSKAYYEKTEKMTGENSVTKWFDVLGREIYSTSKQGDVMVENCTMYGILGQKITEISMHPHKNGWTNYTYGLDGRLKNVLTHTGSNIEYSYNGRSVVTNRNGESYTKTLDCWGNILTQSEPDNSTITNTYSSNGQISKTSVGNHCVNMTYDDKGNRIKLQDPDIGEVTDSYDAYGRIKTHKEPNGSYTLTYDSYGRLLQKAYTTGRKVSYQYINSGNGVGLIDNLKVENGEQTYFTYNKYGQILTKKQKIDNEEFLYTNVYDSWGRTIRHIAPNGYELNYTYDNEDSHLVQVTDKSNKVLWKYVKNIPGREQAYSLGNLLTCTELSSDDESERTKEWLRANGSSLYKLTYELDPQKGNVLLRTEKYNDRSLYERFEYDTMDRLTEVYGSSSMTMSFDTNGNIAEKSDVGNYLYASTRTHAVTDIESPSEELKQKKNQLIKYTEFSKISSIEEGEYKMIFTYGADEQRVKSELYYNNSLTRTIYYGEGYEKHIDSSGRNKEYFYLDANGGTFGMALKDIYGVTRLYYFHNDLLGSLVAISDASGNIVERRNYDAWGRKRNPDNWNDYKNVPSLQLTLLGYTFQEEMPEFGLVNLNGRLYDPFMGRMLSPDPFIQDPENSQNYNRYSYCWNNPMKYTDPNGNFILGFFFPGIGNMADGALWGGLIYSIKAKSNWTFGEFWASMIKGAVFGGISAGTSSAIGDLLGHSLGNLGTELLRSGAHGLASGGINALSGGNFLDGFLAGSLSSLAGSGMQALNINSPLLLGLGAGITGGASAAINGGDWKMGAFQGFIVGVFNHGGDKLSDENYPNMLPEVVVTGRIHRVATAKDIWTAISNIGGGVAFVGENYKVYNGEWLGKNGKWNSVNWGGNQYTGGRNAITKNSNMWNKVGKGLFYVDATTNVAFAAKALSQNDFNSGLKSIFDITFGAVGAFGGPPGLLVGSTYTIMSIPHNPINAPMRSIYYTPCDNTYVAPIIK